TECLKEEDSPQYLGWATTSFEILSNNDEILSIALYLTNGFGGGNMWIPSVRVININPKNRQLMTKDSLIGTDLNHKHLNVSIFQYFYSLFPNDAEETIGKEFIKIENDFNKLEYGVRNDSLVVLLPA